MPPLVHTDTFNTGIAPDEAAQRFAAFHALNGGVVRTIEDGSLEGTTGKRVWVRVLGALFVPRTWWPVKTTVRLSPADSGTSVEMTVADNFGVGIRAGMVTKYNQLLAERADQIKAAMT